MRIIMKISLLKVIFIFLFSTVVFNNNVKSGLIVIAPNIIDSTSIPTVELPDTSLVCGVVKYPIKISYDVYGDLRLFLDTIAQRESRGNHLIINRYGCLGKYQFKRSTLDHIGFSDITDSAFLNNPDIQDSAMIVLLKANKRILGKYIDSFDGVMLDSVLITKSGMLAGAHLVGAGGVLSYLRQDSVYRTYDGNNVHVSQYIDEFKSYDLNL